MSYTFAQRPTPSVKRHRLAALLAAALAVAAVPAPAQTLLQLYDTALGYDAAYLSAQANVQASQARADQARAGLLPQIGVQAGAQRNKADMTLAGLGSATFNYNTFNAALVGTQPLYRPANRIAWDQGQRGADAAAQQLTAAEQDLIVRLAQAYFDVLAAQDSLQVVRALKTAVAEQRQAAQRNFDIGNATITDSHEAQARFDLAGAQEIAADNDLHVKQLALDQLTGLANATPHPLAQPIALPQPDPPQADAWVDLALARHPGIAQARLALDIARLETDKARAGHLPTVDLQASYGQTRYPNGNPSFMTTPGAASAAYRANAASIGVVLNWPLYAGAAVQSRVRETLALQDKARADLDNVQRNVAQLTRAAFFDVQSGLAQVLALQAAEQSSLAALQANQLGYKVGVRINIDVLNAQNQLYQTRRDLDKARYGVLLGLLRLKQASGVLQAADLAPLNQMLRP
jgi:outer membrane protein